MLFLIILCLVVSDYVERTEWAYVDPPPWPQVAGGVAAAVGLVWLLTWLLARRTTAALRSPTANRARRAVVHHRLLWALRGMILGLYLWLTFHGGWPVLVYHLLGPGNWLVLDNWIVVLPFVAMLMAHWIALYQVDILFRRRQASGTVLEPASGVPLEPFRPWTLGQYLSHHFRHSILIVAVPVSIFWTGLEGLAWLLTALGVSREGWYLLSALLLVITIYAVSPLFMRLIWSTRRLPDGPLRQRLEALCRRTRLRHSDILIWRTRCDVVNAAVAGIAGHLRYVFLTDGLLRHLNPDEIEAVFAHEIGHVRHRHLALYLVFASGSMVFFLVLYELVTVVTGAVGGSVELTRDLREGWPFLLATLGLYWGGLFGYLSRRFERQADVFAIRAVSPHPATQPPWPSPRPESRLASDRREVSGNAPRSLDPVALGRFTRALEAVGRLNGMTRNVAGWTHFSIDRRVGFLEQALVDPRVEWRFQRALRRLKWLWLAAALFGLLFLAL